MAAREQAVVEKSEDIEMLNKSKIWWFFRTARMSGSREECLSLLLKAARRF